MFPAPAVTSLPGVYIIHSGDNKVAAERLSVQGYITGFHKNVCMDVFLKIKEKQEALSAAEETQQKCSMELGQRAAFTDKVMRRFCRIDCLYSILET